MAKDQLKYQEPPAGSGVATFSFTEDEVTRHIQRFQLGYQPFEMLNAHYILDDSEGSEDIYPFYLFVRMGFNFWTLSGSGTNEYYYSFAGNPGPLISKSIIKLFIDGTEVQHGTPGSLTAGRWGIGNNDGLDADTLYVRLSDGTDPDTKAEGYIAATLACPCDGASTVICVPQFSAAGQTVVIRPILYAWDLRKDDSDVTKNIPIILDEITVEGLGLDYGYSLFTDDFGQMIKFETYGAKFYALAIVTPPASGTVMFYGGRV